MSMTRYIWDEEDDVVLMEKDENGTTTAVYTHEPGLHGKLISQRRGENTSFYHYDALGSTVALGESRPPFWAETRSDRLVPLQVQMSPTGVLLRSPPLL